MIKKILAVAKQHHPLPRWEQMPDDVVDNIVSYCSRETVLAGLAPLNRYFYAKEDFERRLREQHVFRCRRQLRTIRQLGIESYVTRNDYSCFYTPHALAGARPRCRLVEAERRTIWDSRRLDYRAKSNITVFIYQAAGRLLSPEEVTVEYRAIWSSDFTEFQKVYMTVFLYRAAGVPVSPETVSQYLSVIRGHVEDIQSAEARLCLYEAGHVVLSPEQIRQELTSLWRRLNHTAALEDSIHLFRIAGILSAPDRAYSELEFINASDIFNFEFSRFELRFRIMQEARIALTPEQISAERAALCSAPIPNPDAIKRLLKMLYETAGSAVLTPEVVLNEHDALFYSLNLLQAFRVEAIVSLYKTAGIMMTREHFDECRSLIESACDGDVYSKFFNIIDHIYRIDMRYLSPEQMQRDCAELLAPDNRPGNKYEGLRTLYFAARPILTARLVGEESEAVWASNFSDEQKVNLILDLHRAADRTMAPCQVHQCLMAIQRMNGITVEQKTNLKYNVYEVGKCQLSPEEISAERAAVLVADIPNKVIMLAQLYYSVKGSLTPSCLQQEHAALMASDLAAADKIKIILSLYRSTKASLPRKDFLNFRRLIINAHADPYRRFNEMLKLYAECRHYVSPVMMRESRDELWAVNIPIQNKVEALQALYALSDGILTPRFLSEEAAFIDALPIEDAFKEQLKSELYEAETMHQ